MRSLSNILRKGEHQLKDVEQFFDEGVFYPRLDQKYMEIQQSKKEAMRIIQEAEEQALTHVETFKQMGIEQGLKEIAPLKDLLTSLITEIKEYTDALSVAFEPIITDLVMKVARKVIKDELTTNEKIITKNVVAALATIVDKEGVVIQINPDDMEVMQKHEEAVLAAFRDIKKLTLKTNSTITRGGCYITTERGDLDATIETQFREMAKVFNKDVPFGDK